MTVNTTPTATRPATNRDAAPRPDQQSPDQQSPDQQSPAQQSPAQQSPAQQSPAQRAVIAGTKPRPSSSAGDVVLAYLRTQAHALASLEPRVRADEFDSVHQMRVATRRLRAALRSFRKIIPPADSEHLAAELQWFGQVLGRARDAEVLSGHLQDSLRPTSPELLIGPVRARVQGHYAPRRAAERAALLEALDSPRHARLLAELDRVVAGPARGPQAAAPARDVLPAAVRRAYRQAERRMRRARHAPAGEARDVALHQVRKSARRARYTAEAAEPAAGKPARRFAKQMKAVQTVIGDHHDAVLARREARDLGIGAYLAGENAFSYGLLYERETGQAERLEAQARRTWRRASRRRYRRWMH